MDFPEHVTKMHTKLYPFLKSSLEQEYDAYLKYDRLIVDGQEYEYDCNLQRPVPVPKQGEGQDSGSAIKSHIISSQHANNTVNLDDNITNPKFTNFNICSLNVQGLKKLENDNNFLNYCRKYEIIALYETWQRKENECFCEGYIDFDCLRSCKRTTQCGSGGVTVFVQDGLVNENIVQRIFDDMTEYIVLLPSGDFNEEINDIVCIFAYVAQERSPIYLPEMTMESLY